MKYWPFLLAPLSGALYALAFPHALTEGWFFLSPFALFLMAISLEQIQRTRVRVLAVLLHQTAFNLTGFYWIPHTLQEFGGLPPGVSHLISLFLAPVLNPQWWGWLLWLKYRSRLPGMEKWTSGMHAFFGAVILTCIEMVLPQQFPVFAGHVWMHFHRQLSFADVGGVTLYSFFTWWLVLTFVPLLSRQKPSRAGAIGCVLFLLLHFIPFSQHKSEKTRAINVRVVQANVGNFLKIQSETGEEEAVEDVVTRYEILSLKENPQSLDLIIWPETAYPFSMSSNNLKTRVETAPRLFLDLIARTGAELLIGGYDHDEDNFWNDRFETEYNAAFFFSSVGEFKEVYRKHILIPFGETLPFGPFNRSLSGVIPGVSFFARGSSTPVFETKTGAGFVTPICYEILQSGFIAKLLNEAPRSPDFLVNLTNDSWYGKTAEPFQHLFLAKWRALEFRRPIIRSTNTGITTVIYPNGDEGRRLYTGEQDVLDFRLEVPEIAPLTIYQRWSHLPLVGLWLLISVGFSLLWWKKIRPGTSRANVRLL